MEDKLLELKEQFCKWYCPGKLEQKEIEHKSWNCTEDDDCNKCDDKLICENNLCEVCMVGEYIKFIRDDLN